MAADNKLELVVEVDVNRANASIKSVNAGLSSMESTAANAARGASRGIDGLTVSMAKGAAAGNLFAEAIKAALTWAKDWTVGAIEAASQVSRMTVVTQQLAKAHGIAAEDAMKYSEAIQRIGFENEDALHAIDRLIVADMELSKSEGLAKLAKNAAAIENVSAGEALQGIIQAIESGASRGLRSMGIFVDFQKETLIQELKLGRALTESEERQARYNAVMREGAKIQGAHAAAAGEAESMLKGLKREVHDLQEEVGARFQEDFKSSIGNLRGLAGWLRENTDWLGKFGQAALWVSGILASYALADKIMALAKSVAALNLAKLNPYALLATGVVAAGAIVYSNWKDTKAQVTSGVDEKQRQALRDDLFNGKTSLEQLRKQGMTDDQIRELVSGRKALPGESFGPVESRIAIKKGSEPDVEFLKRAVEIRKRQLEVERESRQAALEAGAKGQLGFAREMAEMNARIEKWTTFTDDRGATRRISLTHQAWESVITELGNRWSAFREKFQKDNREQLAEYLKGEEEAARRRMDLDAEVLQRRLQYNEEIARRNLEQSERMLGVEEQRAGIGRDARLRALEAVDAQTLGQKIAVEQQKAQIEVDYLGRVHDVKMRLFEIETARMVLEEEANMNRLGYRADEIKARIAELNQQRDEIRGANQEATDAAIDAARQNAANRTAAMVRDHNRQLFDSFKRQAEGVFDALLTKSQSIWSAIGSSLKNALLTAIKDVVSSRVAAMLMQLFTGTKVTFQQGGMSGGGGMLGKLGGVLGLGALPVFGGSGSPGQIVIPGGGIPGVTTGTFTGQPIVFGGGGSVGASSAGGGSGLLGMLGLRGAGKGNAAGMLGSLKDFLGFGGGGVQYAPGMATTWQAASMAQKLSALGRSNAALLGGGLLAMDGLRRGGITGLAETTAGGSLVGFKFGGPVGAAIGAAVGAAAGIVRLFIKGAEEKVRAKIKATYGIDVSDKGVLKQIVDISRQGFGGNLDLAIQSPQVREILELYSLNTGQPWRGRNVAALPVSMLQQGNRISFLPPTNAGGIQAPWSSAAGIGDSTNVVAAGANPPAAAAPVKLTLSLDGPATERFLQGQAVQAIGQQPRTVANAMGEAYGQNYSRRETYAGFADPGLVTNT